MINNNYIRKILKNIFKEKYIFILIFILIYFAFNSVGEKFSGKASKGRFSIDSGTYLTIDRQKGLMVTNIEKKEKLAGYLKSYEFFSSINQEKCSLNSFDLSKRNYIVRNNEFYVDIILRFNDKKRISNCLKAIENNIIMRHDFLYNSYIQHLNFQIETLKEIYNEYRDNLPTEKLQQTSIFDLQTKLTPLLMHRNSLIETYKETKIINKREYDEKSIYYASPIVGIFISFLMSILLFIIYFFIKYQKLLKF